MEIVEQQVPPLGSLLGPATQCRISQESFSFSRVFTGARFEWDLDVAVRGWWCMEGVWVCMCLAGWAALCCDSGVL